MELSIAASLASQHSCEHPDCIAKFIYIECESLPDLCVMYPCGRFASEALNDSPEIDGLCEEDCLDAYAVEVAPPGTEVWFTSEYPLNVICCRHLSDEVSMPLPDA